MVCKTLCCEAAVGATGLTAAVQNTTRTITNCEEGHVSLTDAVFGGGVECVARAAFAAETAVGVHADAVAANGRVSVTFVDVHAASRARNHTVTVAAEVIKAG